MGTYKYLIQTWNQREKTDLQQYLRQVAIKWRREPTVHRVEYPTRPERARALGYKAKQGYVVVRVRIRKGGARKPRPRAGRRQKALGVTKYTRAMSLKNIAEQKAKKKFPNLRVLNSYYVWEDGMHHWFETILRDPDNPSSAIA
ncbi:MAG: 50S ribosomal protein L15e [Candidatus Bathyarchaeia archaeon]